MKIFKGLAKLFEHLTKEKNQVPYEEIREPKIQETLKVENEPKVQESPKQQSIEEKSTLDTTIENPYVNQVREWALKKIDLLHEADRHRNAKALAAEFDEWINIPSGVEELDYLCLEDQDWTDDQEIDVR